MESKKFFSKLIFVILVGGLILGLEAGPDHKRLLKDLFTGYDINERPVVHENDTIELKIGMTMINLVEVNVAKGYMEANLWMHLSWNDVNLKWEPSKYGGIDHFSYSSHRVWRPDILLYNSADASFDTSYGTHIVVKHDGNLMYIPPGLFRSSCKTHDVENYPFDEQICTLKFGSWTTDGGKISLQLKSEAGDTSSFFPNGEWELLGIPARANSIYYACCPEPYMDVSYEIQLRRMGGGIFAGASLVLWIGALGILLIFFLPTHSGQRIVFGVGITIGLTIMNFGINSELAGQKSTLVSNFDLLGILNFASVVCNFFLMYFYNRNPLLHSVPILVRYIFCEKLAGLIGMNCPPKYPSGHGGGHDGGGGGNYEELVANLQDTLQRMSGEETQFVNDWQYVAMVLDRLAFSFFAIAIPIFLLAFHIQFW